jgi:hypothetical protein
VRTYLTQHESMLGACARCPTARAPGGGVQRHLLPSQSARSRAQQPPRSPLIAGLLSTQAAAGADPRRLDREAGGCRLSTPAAKRIDRWQQPSPTSLAPMPAQSCR